MTEESEESGRKSKAGKARELFLQESKKRKRISDVVALHRAIQGGDRIALARAVTLVESDLDEDRETADELVQLCLSSAGRAFRIGITGVPGVGKSSFIETLGLQLVNKNHKLAVLAIDPSSERTGGSILGDKTRMEKLSVHPDVFIRPTPASGTLGGVSGRTRESILLYEAAGFDTVIVETVGVGQSETSAHEMVDCFLLLLMPGAGDELQGIKRGIVEMADILAINKADADANRAKESALDYRRALHLFPKSESGWTPPVLTCSAATGMGVDGVWDSIMAFKELTENNGAGSARRNIQAGRWFSDRLREALTRKFFANPMIRNLLPALQQKVLAGEMHPLAAVKELLAL